MTPEPNATALLEPQPPETWPAAGGPSATSGVRDDLQALRAAVEGTAAGTGQEFFRSLVRHLAEAIDVHCAVVGEFKHPPLARTHAIWERDWVAEHRDFDFTTSPSGEVLHSDLVHFPTGVLRYFPRASLLAEKASEGYMAVPLQSGRGRVLGFLSVYDERPMPEEPRRLFIMRIFAARAAAELERIQASGDSTRVRDGTATCLRTPPTPTWSSTPTAASGTPTAVLRRCSATPSRSWSAPPSTPSCPTPRPAAGEVWRSAVSTWRVNPSPGGSWRRAARTGGRSGSPCGWNRRATPTARSGPPARSSTTSPTGCSRSASGPASRSRTCTSRRRSRPNTTSTRSSATAPP